ncbi:unnamed protein product [Onchocerca flexuosa]|uniref:Secreted protein n=1 Tax=Onchocerca flexuosa TaxID=387005 RepID=A0A183H3T7_9BILA|nr:unnamed protein product [Onchocerca flexuosa]
MQGDFNHVIAEYGVMFATNLLFLFDVFQPLSACHIHSVENEADPIIFLNHYYPLMSHKTALFMAANRRASTSANRSNHLFICRMTGCRINISQLILQSPFRIKLLR